MVLLRVFVLALVALALLGEGFSQTPTGVPLPVGTEALKEIRASHNFDVTPLGGIVTVVNRPPGDSEALIAALRSVGRDDHPEFPAGSGLILLATGARLDAGDGVRIISFARNGDGFGLRVIYTSRRSGGGQIRYNINWVPAVELPLPELQPGEYSVEATWTAVESLQGAKPLSAANAIIENLIFRVRN